MQREHPGRSLRTTTSEKTTVHRIPTKMPFQAVFMRGGAQALLAWTISW
jgi:hypothetical protein